MKRISNPFTFALKMTPFLIFSFSVFIFVLVLRNGALQKAPMFLVFPCVIAVFGYYAWKANIRDLLDEVYDCGDYLLVKRGGQEDTVLLSNINYVYFTTDRQGSQRRIHLRLDTPGKFGTELSFALSANFFSPRKSEIAEDLVARTNKARSVPAI